jgi:sialidase-1
MYNPTNPKSVPMSRRAVLRRMVLAGVGATGWNALAARAATPSPVAGVPPATPRPDLLKADLYPIEGVEKQLLVASNDLSPKNSEGTLVVLKNGDILFAWSQFMNVDLMAAAGEPPPPHSELRRDPRSDDGYARIAGMVSRDGGRTWGRPSVLVDDRDATVNCISPGLARTSDGRLMLAYSWRSSGNAEKTEAAKMVRFSSDDGRTWSERTRITPENKEYHTGCHDRAYTLKSGRLLVQCHTLFPGKVRKEMGVYTAYSDDGGKSWRRSAVLAEERTNYFEEGSVVQRIDGSLLMALRASRGNSYFTESTDEGATWSKPRPSGVVSPMAPTLLARLPDSGELLMVWNSNYLPGGSHAVTRCPLLCAISRDDGRTWGLPKALEVNSAYEWAYAGVLFHQGYALLHYFRSSVTARRREVVLARIPVGWFRSENA